ncbi:tyrosine-protein phosphatase [Mucilaginibacter auburnensis]|uniref:protein-tyrosine-phosphatase n=1 Tax=Mucilaginibacter auburnensis TaxID=1457233 RepID=A0A2H9VT78_9SPHI|nr:CpsB/CapC family capsule biosynthesis tyrosine phosphatase [Mucilaginibacter auburnensis]PJJ84004.1 tyrosine-protein phosphatase YwqE [Mucilaginibacter auburnensis]
MFSFFKKKEKPQNKEITFNYESIAVDMHSHVLPGIDDGAQNVEESVFLVKRMVELGIKKIIATPHIMIDFYRNTPETINGALELLRAELKNQGIEVQVEAGAEHYFDETFEPRIDEGKLVSFGDQYVLYEYPFISQPNNWFSAMQKMLSAGYKPILAHPERYPYLTTDTMTMMRGWGCNMQLNTISLTGYYGRETKKRAEEMIDLKLIDFISSDMHHPKHAAAFGDSLRTTYIEKVMFNDYPLKNITLL